MPADEVDYETHLLTIDPGSSAAVQGLPVSAQIAYTIWQVLAVLARPSKRSGRSSLQDRSDGPVTKIEHTGVVPDTGETMGA